MEILSFFESIRTPFLDVLFSLLTKLGEEYLFIFVALLFIWCIDKKCGYIILISGLIGQAINQFTKFAFKVDRPWVKYPELTPLESALETATGYSFPSGHTQIAVTTYAAIGFSKRNNRALSLAMFAIPFIVGISRMYLGVHYFSDVLFSLVTSFALTYLIYKTYNENNYKVYMILSGLVPIAVFFYIWAIPYEEEFSSFVVESLANSSKFLGAALGFVAAWYLDIKKFNFKTDGSFLFKAGKLIIGLLLVLGIKAALKWVFLSIGFNEYLSNVIRYFAVVFFAGVIWPYYYNRLLKK